MGGGVIDSRIPRHNSRNGLRTFAPTTYNLPPTTYHLNPNNMIKKTQREGFEPPLKPFDTPLRWLTPHKRFKGHPKTRG